MTAILGLSAFYHDSAAALVVDGQIVAAAQEERFSRIKHDPAFPARAMGYCLNEAGLGAGQLDYIAFYDKPLDKVRAFAGNLPDLCSGRISQLPAGHAFMAQRQAAHAADDPPGLGSTLPRPV